jgi:hypothetical protein
MSGPVPFRISAVEDTQPGKYIIPIQGNISMESTTLGIPSVNASIFENLFYNQTKSDSNCS